MTPAPARPRRGLETTARSVFWVLAFLHVFYFFLKVGDMLWVTPETPLHWNDFLAFWGAAKLALLGEPVAAFDQATLMAATGYPVADKPHNLLWLYPPGFLALLVPFGALPYWIAWCLFLVISAVALALAVRAPAAALPGGWRLVVVSPVLLVGALYMGQTSALWAAGLVAALWAMRNGRPATAGLWIALLTLKPQLGLLIPFALIAGRQWRTIGWAIAWTALLLAASTLLFGVEYWSAFFDAMADAARRVEKGAMPIARLVSVYGFARFLEAGHEHALLAQGAATFLILLGVVAVWGSKAPGPDLKAGVLCAAIPLATPYAFHYEMAMTVVAAMFLYRDGFGRTPIGGACLLVAWLGAVPGFYVPAQDSVALVGPPVAALVLGIGMTRAWQARPGPRPETAPIEPASTRHAGSR